MSAPASDSRRGKPLAVARCLSPRERRCCQRSWSDSIYKAAAAVLYSADRDAHSRPALTRAGRFRFVLLWRGPHRSHRHVYVASGFSRTRHRWSCRAAKTCGSYPDVRSKVLRVSPELLVEADQVPKYPQRCNAVIAKREYGGSFPLDTLAARWKPAERRHVHPAKLHARERL